VSTPNRLPWLDAIIVEVAKRLRVEGARSVAVAKDGKPFYVLDENGRESFLDERGSPEERFAELIGRAAASVGQQENRVALEQIRSKGSAFRPPTNDAVFEADFADGWLNDMDNTYARERDARLALGFEEAARRFGDKYADEELDALPLGTAEEERARCASYMKLAARWIQKADELGRQLAEHDPDEE
jgi:hypothetical protein